MVLIKIIGFYLLTVVMLVKSECETHYSITSRIPFVDINCENVTFNEDLIYNSTRPRYSYWDKTLTASTIYLKVSNSIIPKKSELFQNFTALISLIIISSNLSTFDFATTQKLKNLILSNNLLSSLNNTNFNNINLETLNVSNNKLSSIYCLNVSQEIDLSHNKLEESCEFAPSIELINLSFNKITQLRYAKFTNLKKLKTLDLSYNNIDYVYDQLENLKMLQYLNLSHNSIKAMYYNCLDGSDSLLSLDLSYNRIENIKHGTFNNLKNLSYLDLSYNNIYEIDVAAVMYSMTHLRSLNLMGNFLKELDVETINKVLTHLHAISLSFSEISCKTLTHYISELRNYHVYVLKGPTLYEHNVHGIHCNPFKDKSSFKDNFEFTMYSVKKVHSLLIVITIIFVLILCKLFVINYYRYKRMRRL